MRKKILYPLLILCMTSCNYLDFDETSNLRDEQTVYKYFNNIRSMLTNVYSYMPQDLGVLGGAMRDCATDDAEYANIAGAVQDFNTGNWSPLRTIDTKWELYNGIRAANGFIESMKTVDLSRFQSSPSYKNESTQLKYYPYQARLLRAFYFFELARRYGDIPMPLEVLEVSEANTIGKTPFADVIGFIVAECNDCAANLPATYLTAELANESGRVTSGFAMALKSKALLYLASQLHNPQMDRQRWKDSAQAALDIINTNLYKLEGAGKAVNNLSSKEVVLLRMNGDNNSFELSNFPLRLTYGSRTGTLARGTFPSQNLAEAFETAAGYPVTLGSFGWESDDPAFDPSNPYANRDPRLAQTILANGMQFKGVRIELFEGGTDDLQVTAGGSPTGYFLRKYLQESTSFTPGSLVTNKHFWVIYRYAETLLTYAESMVEAFDSPDYTDATFTQSARWALNQVRANASMPDVTVAGKEEFTEKLRNEWRVEFAFEDHRFWDIRRWKTGRQTQRELYGVKILPGSSGTLVFSKFLYENRAWDDKMNLFPIMQTELFKNPNLAPQNPGWN